MSIESTPTSDPRESLPAPKGYRQLNTDELHAMDMKHDLGKYIEQELANITSPEAGAACDPRWVAIAKTHFQEGLMALGRAITKPNFF